MVVLAIPVSLYTGSRDPFIQTFMARSVAGYFSKKMGTTITIGTFYVNLDLSLAMKDVMIYDKHNRQLMSVGLLKLRMDDFTFKKQLNIRQLVLENVSFQLVIYEGEKDMNLQFLLDFFQPSSDTITDVTDTISTPYPVNFSNLSIVNGSFRYWDQNYDLPGEPGMDYAHLNINDIQLTAQNLLMLDDSIVGHINHLSANDTCGIVLNHLSADAIVSGTTMIAKDLKIETPESKIDIDLTFKYKNYWAYIEFIDSVKVEATVRPSTLYMADLGYFSTLMFDMTNQVNVSGNVTGFVNDFVANDFNLNTGALTSFRGDIHFKGLPDFYSTLIELNINEFETSPDDIRQFAIPGEMRYIPIPDALTKLGVVAIRGKFNGYYNDFTAQANLNSSIGSVVTDIEMNADIEDGPVSYKGLLETNQLDIGKLIGGKGEVGKLDMNVLVEGSGLSSETLDLNLNGNVGSLEVLGNTFRDIDLSGDLTGNTFNGKVKIDDDKIKLDFSGAVDFSGALPDFDFIAKIRDADLNRLNLLKSDSLMKLSSNIEVNFKGLKINDIEGGVIIDSTMFKDSRGTYLMNHFKLITTNDPLYNRKLTVRSDFFDFELGGIIDYAQISESFKQYLDEYVYFKSLAPTKDKSIVNQDFFIDFRFKDTRTLSRLLMPAVEVAPGSTLSGVFTTQNQILNTTFISDSVMLNGIKLNDFMVNTVSDTQKATVQLGLANIILREGSSADTTVLSIERPKIKATLENNEITFNLEWKDYLEKTRNKGDIMARLLLDSVGGNQLNISQSELLINDSVWVIDGNNEIVFNNDFTTIGNINISMGSQAIRFDGRLPMNQSDTLNVFFKDWNISNFDILTRNYGLDIDGIISGDMQLANVTNQPAFFSNLHIRGLALNEEKLGEARILSSWSNAYESVYMNAQIINVGNVGTSRMLGFSGFYYPKRKSNNLNFDIVLENFRLRTLKPFLKGVLSHIEGLASGDFKLKGSPDKPELSGNLSLMRTAFLIDYLNTYYSVQHDFVISPTEIAIDNVVLYDTIGNKAIASGIIHHDYLSNFRFDVDVKADDFLALNTNQTMNDLFYGSAIVTGDVGFNGTIDDIGISIDGTTRRGTYMYIPISMAASVSDNDYVTFVKPKGDSIAQLMVETTEESGQAFDIYINTRVTPDANVKIFMPYNMGDLTAKGAGNLRMSANSIGEFFLYGDYILQDGQFNFIFENLPRKKFDLMEGGKISWTGDPYDAMIDVKGIYRTKASLSSLGIYSADSSTRRVNVDCIIHLTEQLFKPEIKFSISLPNTDADTQQQVFAVLDTTNEGLITQQVISLLVLGSFSYSAVSNISLVSSSFNVISNQLSSWLSQISKDFDVGVNYKPGDKLTSDELEVALSTQLFNDRVVIEGNLGVSGNNTASSAQSASNIVGDVDVSLKLTDDGRWRVKAYNHSNASSSNNITAYDNYSPYTQGVGISYRKEFDHFYELFKLKKKKQKTRN
ncbi:MAG: translocation/assembly module TamB [Bacteroidales bacterium]|nr:translocation/assembly module TamB [Bacteroidales bacterium]